MIFGHLARKFDARGTLVLLFMHYRYLCSGSFQAAQMGLIRIYLS